MADSPITIEVVYALPDEQALVTLTVPSGTTASQAVAQSGLAERYPDMDPATHGVGIFGRRVEPATPLCDGDRVEIYRPLQVDPKAQRRERAREQRRRG
ncbi:RnfH family protein [Spiribacter pallidus]|uniref:UPF0125 protein V6X73_05380 n=1 Tax=Spiribacter pallidus TaxID=1987936 RepID=A0ABV3TBZ5_9GAMM